MSSRKLGSIVPRPHAGAVVLLSLIVATAGGQDTANVRLERVTVTATRTPISVLQVPLAVSIIGADRLKFTRGYGLDEALNLVPGVVAQSRYGNQDVRITIRGFGARGAGDRSNTGTSRGIRVLLDGIPETEPDGRTSFDDIDLGAARRIDVVRSNASAVWGNAAGGVINVSTVPGLTESSVALSQMTGSFGLMRSTVSGSAHLGSGQLYMTLVNSSFDGWRRGSSSRRGVLNAGW
jgi:iron complex outermembrane recepter protein